MIVNKIAIEKFRGFTSAEFELGTNITVIAGQNGTQKTTVLGLLSQPFTITDKENPIYKEKPLCGGNYKSSFSDKFKLSSKFDLAKNHTWTLSTIDKDNPEFTVESIPRDHENVRFWKKGDKSKGSGYLQYPVIYLSLQRLMPLGEDANLSSSNEIELDKEEQIFLQKFHKQILIIPDLEISSIDYLSSKTKNTLGISTDFYDWKMNSSGQDNLGKILLAVLSFRRLKLKYKDYYTHGLLVIDEIDTTLYPASQIRLFEALRKFSSQFNLQIIFTTHSLTLLEEACKIQDSNNLKNQVKVVYLQKVDREIKVNQNVKYSYIQDKLNVTLSGLTPQKKITTFSEDKETEIFLKGLLKTKASSLKFLQCTLGCNNYIALVKKKIKGFTFPESIICLDGDVILDKTIMKEIAKQKNFLILPGGDSPERLLATYLFQEPESSEIWDTLFLNYSKQFCFSIYSYNEILDDRNKAKSWFKSQEQYWGRSCTKIINLWAKQNNSIVDDFIKQFESLMAKFRLQQ
ncbi:AAA family ATPase [Flavobacterium fluviale]|uniref:ATP-binding protein n=1 Tax=Flavobacterium fluviale TaxID=2249356 RepID=A0A344LUZ7_9FLAO|nr:AAA family ATPase [Flavobacterium fluviale]AXB57739.1 ATP-binding protein [Flavobacterium fluviale]